MAAPGGETDVSGFSGARAGRRAPIGGPGLFARGGFAFLPVEAGHGAAGGGLAGGVPGYSDRQPPACMMAGISISSRAAPAASRNPSAMASACSASMPAALRSRAAARALKVPAVRAGSPWRTRHRHSGDTGGWSGPVHSEPSFEALSPAPDRPSGTARPVASLRRPSGAGHSAYGTRAGCAWKTLSGEPGASHADSTAHAVQLGRRRQSPEPEIEQNGPGSHAARVDLPDKQARIVPWAKPSHSTPFGSSSA